MGISYRVLFSYLRSNTKHLIMKHLYTLALLASCYFGFSQAPSAEDALNRLINNPEFVKDVMAAGEGELTPAKLNQYLASYVPDQSNTVINGAKLDLNKLYFANSGNVQTDVVANKLSSMLKLDDTQAKLFSGLITGNAPAAKPGSLRGLLYEQGKDKKTDLAVDAAVDFFQKKIGGNAFTNSMIDIGGGLMGSLITKMNKRYYEKLAQERLLERLSIDKAIYQAGSTSLYDPQKKKVVIGKLPEHEDLFLHFTATQSMPSNYIGFMENKVDYAKAVSLLDKAIALYRENPERGYYLYNAYLDRAVCKMELGQYRAAIVDYYYADDILSAILAKKLPDNSLNTTFPPGFFDMSNKATFGKGKPVTVIGSLNQTDKMQLLIARAYAKYRQGDFTGALADSGLAAHLAPSATAAKGISYQGMISAINGMAQFGMKNYEAAEASFNKAGIGTDIIGDKDKDGLADFMDLDKEGQSFQDDKLEGFDYIVYPALPVFFPFDLIQVKGLVAAKTGKMDEAIQLYEAIVTSENGKTAVTGQAGRMFSKASGDISAVYGSLATFYYDKGEKKKALELLDSSIDISPEEPAYYVKRGTYRKAMGMAAEAAADFKKAKNPAAADPSGTTVSSSKRSLDYYQTQLDKNESSGNPAANYTVLTDALKDYPDKSGFFNGMVKSLALSKDPAKATAAGAIKGLAPKYAAVFNALAAEYAGDAKTAEDQYSAAFANGFHFYDARMAVLDLHKKPYYCRLLSSHLSKTNNNFIAADFSREKTVRMLDSLYNSMPIYREATGATKKMLDKSKAKEYAKNLGEIEKYLEALDDDKTALELSPIMTLDKVECLMILGKKAEAVNVAQKAVQGKKMRNFVESMPQLADTQVPYFKALQNIADGACGK